MAGDRTRFVSFRYLYGGTINFIGDTVSFQSLLGPTQIAEPFYEKAVIGFSALAGSSGGFGMRFFWLNPARPSSPAVPSTTGQLLNSQNLAGFTGVTGASAGIFGWSIAGLGTTLYPGAASGFVTPSVLEINRTGGDSSVVSVVIAGYLWNS